MGDTWAALYHPPMFSNAALILQAKTFADALAGVVLALTVQCYKTNVIPLLLCF